MEQLKTQNIDFLNRFVLKGKEYCELNKEINILEVEYDVLRRKDKNLEILEEKSKDKLVIDERKKVLNEISIKNEKLTKMREDQLSLYVIITEGLNDIKINEVLILQVKKDLLPNKRLEKVLSEDKEIYFVRCCKLILESKFNHYKKIELDRFHDIKYVQDITEFAHMIHYSNVCKCSVYNYDWQSHWKLYHKDKYFKKNGNDYECYNVMKNGTTTYGTLYAPDISKPEIFSLDSIQCLCDFKPDSYCSIM